jgi:hypothetical protein
MIGIRTTAFGVVLLLVSILPRAASAGPRILLRVSPAESAWSSVGIEEKLLIRMTRDTAMRVVNVNRADNGLPDFPEDHFNLDRLVEWGQEIGGQYLMLVDVHDERLERRKTWEIPLFFQKYETMGVISGELRLIDLKRGVLLLSQPFLREQKAKRVTQGSPDDNINHPNLHMTAPNKLIFFDQMEDHLCDQLLESIGFTERGNNGE